MCNEATLNRIIQTVQELPEASAAAVLDFAEFLQSRKVARAIAAGDFEIHFGSLKQAPLFRGRDPIKVQRELRDGSSA